LVVNGAVLALWSAGPQLLTLPLPHTTLPTQGLDAPTLLAHGLPPYLADLLLHAFGVWDTTAWRLALTAAAVPLTAWGLRAWWAGNLQLLAHGAGQLQQQLQRRWQQASTATPSSSEEPADSAAASGSSKLLAAAAIVFRGACLSALVSSLASLLYSSSSSSSSSLGGADPWVTTAVHGFGAFAAALGAFGLLLLRQPSHQPSSSKGSSSSSSSTATLLGPLLALEAAWVASMVGLHPLVNAAAAAVVAGSLMLLQRTAVLPRLQQYTAAAGDDVAVHVSLSLAGTRPVFDSTAGDGSPLSVTAGPVPAEYAQLWEQARSGQLWDEATTQEGADAASSSSSDAPSVRQVQQELQGWLRDPEARWDSLRPFIAAAAQGLYLGETRSVPLHNPPDIGYWHPAFSWWQPASDVSAKFGGEPPQLGEVFWYPVVDGAALPTRVKSVGQDFYELDANYGVTDTPLTLHVQLVELRK
jgi:hypothetical protein